MFCIAASDQVIAALQIAVFQDPTQPGAGCDWSFALDEMDQFTRQSQRDMIVFPFRIAMWAAERPHAQIGPFDRS